MRLEELVGMQLVVGIPGATLTPAVADHLRAIRAGGFIAFERNWKTPEQFRALVAQLHDAMGRRLLVMVDHEGGRVVRFSSGVTRFPDALTVGATQRPEEVCRQGEIEARELASLGVHVNLAPCVDVLVDGADPIIGTRSYGRDPQHVAALGAARIQGLQRGGVAACAKHFPGIGSVPKDPHKHLPVVTMEWPDLRTAHLVPFVEAIRTGVAAIMSSHVCYPRLEPAPDTPATFSAHFMQELLRQELGFEGVVMSDDLEMGALRTLAPIGEAAVRAVQAGHDVLLICSDLASQRAVYQALCEAYRSGRLSRDALERSITRITTLAQQFSSSP